MTRISRRAFVWLGAAGAVAAPLALNPTRARAATPTAQDVADPDPVLRLIKAGEPFWTPR